LDLGQMQQHDWVWITWQGEAHMEDIGRGRKPNTWYPHSRVVNTENLNWQRLSWEGDQYPVYQNFKGKLIPTLLKHFHEIEREGARPKSFYEAYSKYIHKLDKDTTTTKENYRPISLRKNTL
jgi:hypothetical protein